MFDAGLVEEVRGLWSSARPLSAVAAQGVGYREVIEMLQGKVGLTATMERVRARSRQFAKRQCTWFRGLAEVRPWPVLPDDTAESVAERLADEIKADRARSGNLLSCSSPDGRHLLSSGPSEEPTSGPAPQVRSQAGLLSFSLS